MQVRPHPAADESGFTLIEVLISVVVLGVIASGVAASIILFFKTADGTTNRLALSHDSQLLATYLIPDLDNLTGASSNAPGYPITTPPAKTQSQTCQPGAVPFASLEIPFADLGPQPNGDSQVFYKVDYIVNDPVITRKVYVGGDPNPQSSTDVVHNVYGQAACFSRSQSAPWTMTVTTATPGVDCTQNPLDCYTFSVTGGGRVTPPTPPGAPAVCGPTNPTCSAPGLVSMDTNGDGKVDEVIASFDQPLNVNDTASNSQWVLSGQFAGVSVQSVAISGSRATITLNEVSGQPVDTVAAGFTVRLAADANGIRNGANQAASFAATQVTDGMAPVETSVGSADLDAATNTHHIGVTFSEPLAASSYSAGLTPATGDPWTLTSGVTLAGVTVTGSAANLTVDYSGPIPAGFQIGLGASPMGIQDGSGNLSQFGPVAPDRSPGPTVSPSSLGIGATNTTVVITGGKFAGPVGPFTGTVVFTNGVTVNSVTLTSATTLTANVSLTAATAGAATITVTNPDPDPSADSIAFTVSAAPIVSSTNPQNLGIGATNTTVVITGANFEGNAGQLFTGTVAFTNGVTVNSVNLTSATKLTANVSLTAATVGTATITVINPDFGVGSNAGAFTVNAAPRITSFGPPSVALNATTTITVIGTQFVSGATVSLPSINGTVTIGQITFVNSTQITVKVTGATKGTCNVVVTNPDGGTFRAAQTFLVS